MWITASLWCEFALAGPVILSTAPPEEAVRAANERGLVAGSDVRTIPLSELRGRPAFLDGTGRVWGCSTVAEGTIALHVGAAERAMGYSRLLEAEDALDDALGVAVCQNGLDVSALWRVWFLEGILATWLEDPERARRAFQNARTLDPDEEWDEQFVDGRPWFDEAATSLPADLRLSVLPDPGGAVVVDGHDPVWSGTQIVLTAGSHFLQIGRVAPITLRVEISGRGTATLVVPSLLPDEVLDWPSRPDRWRDLDLVVRGLVPDAEGPWGFYAPPNLWWGPMSVGPFLDVPPPPVPPPPRGAVPAWVWLTGSVGVTAGAGAGICTVGGRRAGHAVLADIDASYPEFASSLDTYRSWSTCVVAADVIAVTGLGAAAVGIVRHLRHREP